MCTIMVTTQAKLVDVRYLNHCYYTTLLDNLISALTAMMHCLDAQDQREPQGYISTQPQGTYPLIHFVNAVIEVNSYLVTKPDNI